MRYLLLPNVQTGHHPHTVLPSRQQQYAPFSGELDQLLGVAVSKEDQADDQAAPTDRADELREPPRKPFEPVNEIRRRPLQMRNELALAQPVQHVEADGTCEWRPPKRRSVRTCPEYQVHQIRASR